MNERDTRAGGEAPRAPANAAHQLGELRRELKVARRQASISLRIRSEFLANMSHELRTPMTAILGFTDLLLEEAELPAAERLEHLRTIRRNGDRLMRLLGDIFDLTQLDAGELRFDRAPIALHPMVHQLAEELGVAAMRKGLDLDVSLIGPLPETIQSDPERLQQTLRRMIENAIQCTEAGGVRMTVQLTQAENGNPCSRIRFTVADTGPGLSPDELESVFEPFATTEQAKTRELEGAGLGLTIASRFASVLGGELRAESIEGHGSVFELTLDPGSLEGQDLREIDTRDPDDPEDRSTRTLVESLRAGDSTSSVLYVEDGPDNRRLVSFLLRKAGLEVTCAEDGAEGVSRALAARDEGAPFDVVLMDMQMPVLDGCGATRKLREVGWSGPIIALTASDLDGMRQLALEAGCDHFLTKPLRRRHLLGMILRVLRD